MIAHRSFGIALLCAALCAGCAETTFRGTVKKDTNGIRYYQPATYVLIKPDYVKGEANITWWVGPDTSEVYAADPYAIASTNTTELKFQNGFLSSSSSEVDTTKVAADAIAALDDLAKSILTTAAKGAQLAAGGAGRPPNTPDIYLFVIKADGTFLTLFSPDAAPAQ